MEKILPSPIRLEPTGTALARRLAPHHNFTFITPLPILLTYSVRKQSSSGTVYKTIGDMCQSCQSNPYFERFEMKKMKLYITFHIYIYIIRIEMGVLTG